MTEIEALAGCNLIHLTKINMNLWIIAANIEINTVRNIPTEASDKTSTCWMEILEARWLPNLLLYHLINKTLSPHQVWFPKILCIKVGSRKKTRPLFILVKMIRWSMGIWNTHRMISSSNSLRSKIAWNSQIFTIDIRIC